MPEKERIEHLEVMFSEMLLKQDRMTADIATVKADIAVVKSDVSTIRTTQLQTMQLVVKKSDNVSVFLEKQVEINTKLDQVQQMLQLILAKLSK